MLYGLTKYVTYFFFTVRGKNSTLSAFSEQTKTSSLTQVIPFQFQKSYPDVYKERFPTPESEAVLFPEKSKQKPLLTWGFKRPFQPFQRTRSLRI